MPTEHIYDEVTTFAKEQQSKADSSSTMVDTDHKLEYEILSTGIQTIDNEEYEHYTF